MSNVKVLTAISYKTYNYIFLWLIFLKKTKQSTGHDHWYLHFIKHKKATKRLTVDIYNDIYLIVN